MLEHLSCPACLHPHIEGLKLRPCSVICYNVAFNNTHVEQLNQLYILKVSVLWILEEPHFSALASSGYRKTHSYLP